MATTESAAIVALAHAWHGRYAVSTSGLEEWARICTMLFGSIDPAKQPTDSALKEIADQLEYENSPRPQHPWQMTVDARWTFTIDEPTPSLNVLRRQYANARHYATLRNRFEQYVMVARMNEKIPKATKPRTVIITRYATQEKWLLDQDNFVGGCKPLLDALVRQGLIVDDDAKHLDCSYKQIVDKDGKSRTSITLMEAS